MYYEIFSAYSEASRHTAFLCAEIFPLLLFQKILNQYGVYAKRARGAAVAQAARATGGTKGAGGAREAQGARGAGRTWEAQG